MSRNIDTYDQQAAQLAVSYNSLVTPDILPDFAAYILSLPDSAHKRVLDLGCGSGRDAFWLAHQGMTVDAVDGAPEMLAAAHATHSHALIHYIHDAAPALTNLQARGRKYDVILMNAFLFHFDEAERQQLYGTLSALLRPDTYLYVTLRHGPVPEGRQMYEVPMQELEDFARQHNGTSTYLGQKQDPLKREGVYWDHVCLQLKP